MKRALNHVVGKFYRDEACGSCENFVMNGPEVLEIARDALWITLQTAAPIMLVGRTALSVEIITNLFTPLSIATFAKRFVPRTFVRS